MHDLEYENKKLNEKIEEYYWVQNKIQEQNKLDLERYYNILKNDINSFNKFNHELEQNLLDHVNIIQTNINKQLSKIKENEIIIKKDREDASSNFR